VSCLEEGVEYVIQLSYKIVDGTYTEIHQNNSDNLPVARLRSHVFDTTDLTNKKWITQLTMEVAATATDSPLSGWRTMAGTFTVSETIANADKTEFYIQGGPDQLLIDNVSITKQVAAGRRGRQLRGVNHE